MEVLVLTHLLTLLLTLTSGLEGNRTFSVYWNVPTEACRSRGIRFEVQKFGFVQNTGDEFYGDRVSIFYRPGAFPYFNGSRAVRGGVPQEGSVEQHQMAFYAKVSQQMPLNFTGIAVLDFEDYFPELSLSSEIYKNASFQWTKERYPSLPPWKLKELSETWFNASSRKLFKLLLEIGPILKPGAIWGYYHYPYCQNYSPEHRNCSSKMTAANDAMSWLFEASTALFPSLYVTKGSGFNPQYRRRVTETRLREAIRVRERSGRAMMPILPYVWCRYHDDPGFLEGVDLISILGQSRLMGINGAVIWDSLANFKTEKSCSQFWIYTETTLGPLVSYLKKIPLDELRSALSSEKILNISLQQLSKR